MNTKHAAVCQQELALHASSIADVMEQLNVADPEAMHLLDSLSALVGDIAEHLVERDDFDGDWSQAEIEVDFVNGVSDSGGLVHF